MSNHTTAPRMGPPLGRSNSFWALVHGGPLTGAEIPPDGGPNPSERRRYDIRKFNASVHHTGGGSSVGPTVCVYYLNEYHDPESVVRKWLAANRRTLEHKETTTRALTHAFGGAFADAWREIRDDWSLQWLADGDYPTGNGFDGDYGECPRCGTSLDHPLPVHLRHADGDCLDGDRNAQSDRAPLESDT